MCRQLILFTEDEDTEVWKGYLYAFLLFVVSLIHSCFYQQVFHIGMTTGMKIKSALIAMVYRKVRNALLFFLNTDWLCFAQS